MRGERQNHHQAHLAREAELQIQHPAEELPERPELLQAAGSSGPTSSAETPDLSSVRRLAGAIPVLVLPVPVLQARQAPALQGPELPVARAGAR